MSSPSVDVKEYDEKQAPISSNEHDGRRSSINHINALVSEGKPSANLRLPQFADNALSR